MAFITNNVAIGSDHAGFELKEKIKKHFSEKGIRFHDFGTNSEESVDYPDYAHPLAKSVSDGKYGLGIVICGSGNGVNMTVNKHQKIRSALCWNPEIAGLARQHNNANIIALPARFVSFEEAISMLEIFLSTEFEGGRHQKRIDKIPGINC